MTGLLPSLGAMACGYLLLLAGVELWFRRGAVRAETTRKAAHLGGALLTLPLPWMFHDLTGPLLLGAGFMAFLHASRENGWLRSVHGVDRPSHGAVLFPLGLFAGLALALHHHAPWIHIVSVLEVGVCDALAAVAGSRGGGTRLGDGRWAKSVEGSAAFFASSLLVTSSALWASGALPAVPALGTGLALGVLFTWTEFLGRKGLDNLLLPLAAGILLPLALEARPGRWILLGAAALGLAGAFLAVAKTRDPRRLAIPAGSCPPTEGWTR